MNTAKKLLTALAALFVVIGFTACDKGFTSVDSDTQLSELSEEDTDTFCSEAEEHVDEELTDERKQKLGCVFGASMAVGFAEDGADPESTCQDAFDECMNEAPEEEASPADDFQCPIRNAGDCSATVEQIEGCMVAVTDQLVDTIDNFSCSDFANEEEELVETPEACSAIEDQCPDLYEQMGPM